MMMEFEIVIQVEKKLFKMRVKRIYNSDQIEKFEIKGGSRSIILRSNRPLLRGKGIKKTRRPNWKIEDGSVLNAHAFALTILALEKKIEELDNPPLQLGHWKNE